MAKTSCFFGAAWRFIVSPVRSAVRFSLAFRRDGNCGHLLKQHANRVYVVGLFDDGDFVYHVGTPGFFSGGLVHIRDDYQRVDCLIQLAPGERVILDILHGAV